MNVMVTNGEIGDRAIRGVEIYSANDLSLILPDKKDGVNVLLFGLLIMCNDLTHGADD